MKLMINWQDTTNMPDDRVSFTYYDGNFEINGGNDENASGNTTHASVPNHG